MDGPRRSSVALLLLLASVTPCFAQGTAGPQVSGSRVGYIDNAIPGDLARFRFDASYDNNRPSRAEFFWPQAGKPSAPGPLAKEFHVDYQDFTAYLENGIGERFSAFVEMPVRLVNPTVDPNTFGVGDI